jgi:hypothetical protein
MLAVSAVLPDTMPDHPPLILIHGSANSAAALDRAAYGLVRVPHARALPQGEGAYA